MATSADGTNLCAAVANGRLYTSTDAGVSWTPRESNRQWSSVASSTDGSKLVAAVRFGQLSTSTDYGVSWSPSDSNRDWRSVASTGACSFSRRSTSCCGSGCWLRR